MGEGEGRDGALGRVGQGRWLGNSIEWRRREEEVWGPAKPAKRICSFLCLLSSDQDVAISKIEGISPDERERKKLYRRLGLGLDRGKGGKGGQRSPEASLEIFQEKKHAPYTEGGEKEEGGENANFRH